MKSIIAFVVFGFYCVSSVAQPTIYAPRNPILNSGLDWFNYGYGVRAQSLGNAMIARKGDLSSLWWNPAGLQQDSVWHIEISGFGAYRSLLDIEKNELGNEPTTLSPSFVGLQIPTKFEDIPVTLAITFQNQRDFTNRRSGDFTLGEQFQTLSDPFMYENEMWSLVGRNYTSTSAVNEAPVSQKALSVGVAIQANSWVRLGASLRVHIFNETMTSRLDRTSLSYAEGLQRQENGQTLNTPLPAGSNVAAHSTILFSDRQTIRLSYDENTSVALQPNFGAQFEISKRFSLPFDMVLGVQFSPQREVERTFSYQLESAGELEASSISAYDGSNFLLYTARQQNYEANIIEAFPSASTLNYALPSRFGLGILVRKNRISVSLDAINTSPNSGELIENALPGVAELIYTDLYFDEAGNQIPPSESDRVGFSGPEQDNTTYPFWNWNEYRIGLEYLAGEKKNIAIRFGYHQLPGLNSGPFINPVFGPTFLTILPPEMTTIGPRRTFSIGSGFSWGAFDIDMAYSLMFSKQARPFWPGLDYSFGENSTFAPTEIAQTFRPHTQEYVPYSWNSLNHRLSVGIRYNFKIERELPDYYQLD